MKLNTRKMLDRNGIEKNSLTEYVRWGWREKLLFTENARQGWYKKSFNLICYVAARSFTARHLVRPKFFVIH